MDSITPLVSVIIPAYNTEPFLARCLDSILCQTLPDFELILIDDGSTDGTGAIADRYAEKDSRVRVIHKENGGVSSARNRGLEVARGEFITFVDADDTVAPTYLEVLHRALCENDADISAVGIVYDTTGNHCYCPPVDRSYTQNQIDDINIILTCWAHMFRRSSMTVFRFPEDIRYSEDTLFVAQNLYGRPGIIMSVVSEQLYTYEHSNPLAATAQPFNIKRLDIVEAYHRMREVVKDYPPVLALVQSELNEYVWWNYRKLLSTGLNTTYPSETARLRSEFLEGCDAILAARSFKSRIIPWVCIRSERLGQRLIRYAEKLKHKEKKA